METNLSTFDSCRILGKSSKGSGGFIFYSMGGGVEQFEDAANIAWLRKKFSILRIKIEHEIRTR